MSDEGEQLMIQSSTQRLFMCFRIGSLASNYSIDFDKENYIQIVPNVFIVAYPARNMMTLFF